MAINRRKLSVAARYLLAGVRIVNGTGSLLIPDRFARIAGVDPVANPAALYALRLFGIRTIYIGAELLLRRGDDLRKTLRIALVIHASDATAAYLAGKSGQLPPGPAKKGTAISGFNVLLAVLAQGSVEPSRRLPRQR